MTRKLTTVGFDADDTLWENEKFFKLTQDRFASLLADFAAKDHLAEQLLQAEKRNLGRYGFGIKGFVLSMIETAIEVTEAKVPASIVQDIILAGQEMLTHPIELLPHAKATLQDLADTYCVILITKGDLLDQERKLAQSGLGGLFAGVEIVSKKSADIYREIFLRYGGEPTTSMMVGNSMRSDILPALAAGSWGVFVPHSLSWEPEQAAAPTDNDRYFEISDLGYLGALIRAL
ncbi:MAG: HAD family hydrolase [Paracoccaceae bacterium]